VNPLAEFAGTGLFSWLEDWQIILGEKPFEFRTHLVSFCPLPLSSNHLLF